MTLHDPVSTSPSLAASETSAPVATPPASRRRWRWIAGLLIPIAIVAAVVGVNELLVGRVVRAQSRAGEYALRGHYRWYVDPRVLVIDLAHVDDTSPVSLFGGLADAAAALHQSGRTFSRIELAAGPTTIFLLDPDGMTWLAQGPGGLEMMQGITAHLRLPSGERAFEANAASNWFWGSAPEDVSDARAAAQAWVNGEPIASTPTY